MVKNNIGQGNKHRIGLVNPSRFLSHKMVIEVDVLTNQRRVKTFTGEKMKLYKYV